MFLFLTVILDSIFIVCHLPSAQEARYFPLLLKSISSIGPVCPLIDVKSQG